MAGKVITEVSKTKVTKEIAPKKRTTKKKPTVRKIITRSDKNLEKILIENFISMQKVMTHLASKFDKLEHKMSGLLHLFEQSAETLAKKDINLEIQGNEETQQDIMDKLKNIFEQNKLIAKGLTLMHEAAVNPNISYAIGKGEEQEIPKKKPQITVSKEMPQMTASKKMPTEETFQYPEVTSGAPKPKVMEETEAPGPTFSI